MLAGNSVRADVVSVVELVSASDGPNELLRDSLSLGGISEAFGECVEDRPCQLEFASGRLMTLEDWLNFFATKATGAADGTSSSGATISTVGHDGLPAPQIVTLPLIVAAQALDIIALPECPFIPDLSPPPKHLAYRRSP